MAEPEPDRAGPVGPPPAGRPRRARARKEVSPIRGADANWIAGPPTGCFAVPSFRLHAARCWVTSSCATDGKGGGPQTACRVRTLNEALRRWNARRQGLRPFGDADALITFLRDPKAGERSAKDAALAAVAMEATGGDQLAGTLLLWLVLPGLTRLRQRLGAWDAIPAEDLDAELVSGVWEAATEIHPGTSRVAARLVNRARWRALAAMRPAIDWEHRSEPLPAQVEDLSEGSGSSDGLLAAALAQGVISEDEAELLLSSRRTIVEIRDRLGLTVYGAQNRRRRAKARLRAWLAGTKADSSEI